MIFVIAKQFRPPANVLEFLKIDCRTLHLGVVEACVARDAQVGRSLGSSPQTSNRHRNAVDGTVGCDWVRSIRPLKFIVKSIFKTIIREGESKKKIKREQL